MTVRSAFHGVKNDPSTRFDYSRMGQRGLELYSNPALTKLLHFWLRLIWITIVQHAVASCVYQTAIGLCPGICLTL